MRKNYKKGTSDASSEQSRKSASDLPIAIDPTIASTSRSFLSLRQQEFENLLDNVQTFLPNSPNGAINLDPVEAGQYLQAVRAALEDRSFSLAQTYTPTEWLWYFRRISREHFRGHLSTTAPMDHAISETLTNYSLNADDSRRISSGEMSGYPTRPEDLRPVAQMAALGVLLSQVHAWLRRAGKGTRFEVYPQSLPAPTRDRRLEARITSFDRRVDKDHGSRWLQGLRLIDRHIEADEFLMLTIAPIPGMWPEVPGWLGPLENNTLIKVYGQFICWPTDITDLRKAFEEAGFGGGKWWPDALPALITLLQVMMIFFIKESKSIGISVPKVGYTTVVTNALIDMIDSMLPVLEPRIKAIFPEASLTSGQEVWNQITSITPTLWPYRPGPVVRSAGEYTLVNIYTATRRLFQMVTMPRDLGTEAINVISDRFEQYVQNGIDASKWAPPQIIRELRGRNLRMGSRVITDIDSIACRNRTLILIDCKNIPLTPLYDTGSYQHIRNVESNMINYVNKWHEKVALLQSMPVGDNYDFRNFRRILGVVVTPHVVFSHSDLLVAPIAPGVKLRAASSVGEFFKFVSIKH